MILFNGLMSTVMGMEIILEEPPPMHVQELSEIQRKEIDTAVLIWMAMDGMIQSTSYPPSNINGLTKMATALATMLLDHNPMLAQEYQELQPSIDTVVSTQMATASQMTMMLSQPTLVDHQMLMAMVMTTLKMGAC
jgi:hypothetical protein